MTLKNKILATTLAIGLGALAGCGSHKEPDAQQILSQQRIMIGDEEFIDVDGDNDVDAISPKKQPGYGYPHWVAPSMRSRLVEKGFSLVYAKDMTPVMQEAATSKFQSTKTYELEKARIEYQLNQGKK